MSPLARTAALSLVWIAGIVAVAALLVIGVVSLSDAVLRIAFALIALVTLVASLLLFPSPQPAAPRGESRQTAQIRASAELRASLR
jgi:hypothetical protein